jgi:hypothetical protein
MPSIWLYQQRLNERPGEGDSIFENNHKRVLPSPLAWLPIRGAVQTMFKSQYLIPERNHLDQQPNDGLSISVAILQRFLVAAAFGTSVTRGVNTTTGTPHLPTAR